VNTQKPIFGFIGDPNGVLALQVQNSVTLAPHSGALVAGQRGLLIDGATASTLDRNTFAQVLSSGGLLAVANPAAEQITMLGGITGQTPSTDVAMVIFKKASNRPGYKCIVVPFGNVTLRVTTGSEAPQETTTPITVDFGRLLADESLDRAELGDVPPGLVPQVTNCYCGYRSAQIQGNWYIPPPNFNGNWDDNTAQTNGQQWNYEWLTEFFVYWVNGGTAPYYVVIVRQTGPMSIGTPLANSQDSRGWFNLFWNVSPNSVSVNGETIPPGVESAGSAPQSGSNNTQLPVEMQIPMTLYGSTQNGTGKSQFVATVDDFFNYPNWGVLNQTQGASTAWEGYQTMGWNYVENPTSQDLFTDNNVVPMADQSFGAVDFETVTGWTFDNSLFTTPTAPPGAAPFTPPPSLSVTFSFGFVQNIAFLHGTSGCHGASGKKGLHIWWYNHPENSSLTLDLGSVVLDQGFIPS
jgi:hypothetical protein